MSADIQFERLKRGHLPFVASIHGPRDWDGWLERERPAWLVAKAGGKEAACVQTMDWDLESRTLLFDVAASPEAGGLRLEVSKALMGVLRGCGWRLARAWVAAGEAPAWTEAGFQQVDAAGGSAKMEMLLAPAPPRPGGGRGAKVSACWLGDRRSQPCDSHAAYAMVSQMWEFDSAVDHGMPVDTVYVHNVPAAPPKFPDGYAKCREFLLGLAGRRTVNGEVSIIERENKGLSFGAFNHAFQELKGRYGFFLFLEDDEIVIRDGVMAQAARQLMLPAGVQPGFIAAVAVCNHGGFPLHAGGGCGAAAREVLEKCSAALGGSLKCFPDLEGYGDQRPGRHDSGEIWFTNSIMELGHPLEEIEMDDVLMTWHGGARNWRCVVPRSEEAAWNSRAARIGHRRARP